MQKQMTQKDLVKNSGKEIRLKVKEIINSNQPLSELASEKFPVLVSFKLSKTLKELSEITELFYKRRKEILEELGTLNPKGEKYEFKEGKEAEATEAINKELEEEITLHIFQVKLSELGETKIAPRVFAILDWYFTE